VIMSSVVYGWEELEGLHAVGVYFLRYVSFMCLFQLLCVCQYEFSIMEYLLLNSIYELLLLHACCYYFHLTLFMCRAVLLN
jgi:hypothetical protein